MRTKALLVLAALAVSAATCVAQDPVYSLNIVGYVNVDVNPGLNLISNPLKPSNGDYNITNTISLPDAADGALIFKWAGTGWATEVPSWISLGGGVGVWDTPMVIPHGESFFLQSPVAAKVLFVGEVSTGDVPYSIPTGLSAVANKVPVAEEWPGSTHGNDGDLIYTWAGSAWNSAVWNYIDLGGGTGAWNAGGATDDPDGPTLAVGGGAMYLNSGTTALSWTRAFNPQ
jgi:hypothetical protein